MDLIVNTDQGAILVESMPKSDFRKRILKYVAMMPEFSALISSGDVEGLSESEKNRLRLALKEAGIPPEYVESEEGLMNTAIAIAARAVALR